MEFLSDKIIEIILMSATTGQFAQQLIEETFSQSWQKFDEAKKQSYNAFVSGGGSLITYLLTQQQIDPKTASIVFLSGIFATTALKLLKRKNEIQTEKIQTLARKVDDQRLEDKEQLIQSLQKQLSELQQRDK